MSKVLLCDDSVVILRILEHRVVGCGQEVVGKARDGEECVELYKKLSPDLLLLDITMPNMDGREVLHEIMSENPQAVVIMVSGVSDSTIREQCLKEGARAFIRKEDLNSDVSFNSRVLPVLSQYMKVA